MPNWCENVVFLTHKDQTMIDRVEKSIKDGSLMDEFFPCPKELSDTTEGYFEEGTYAQELNKLKQELNKKFFGAASWYDWRIKNWGTKWDVDGRICEQSPNYISLFFNSAWSPPTSFYDKLCELEFEVKGYYYEPGMAFCGIYDNGFEDSYEIEGNSEWVKENIPEDIDLEFAISENMEQWEAEQEEE
jgi:hypothetical protein